MKRLIILSLLFCLTGCSQGNYERNFLLMGTTVKIKIPGIPRPGKAVSAAIKRMERISAIFNTYDKRSEVSLLDQTRKPGSAGISDELSKVLESAFYFHNLTGGAFDVTVAPLQELWGLDTKKARGIPRDSEIRKTLSFVGMQNIDFYPKKKEIYFRKTAIRMDFNAIAKGYAVDEGARILRAYGIRNFLVEAGGDLFCLGKNGERPWTIGIKDPRDKRKIIGVLKLENKAVATSGGYENNIVIDGTVYSHIIDPRTGFPVNDSILSASAIADDCLTADALATVFCILSPKESLRLCEREKNLDCIIIYERGGEINTLVSSGIAESVRFSEHN